MPAPIGSSMSRRRSRLGRPRRTARGLAAGAFLLLGATFALGASVKPGDEVAFFDKVTGPVFVLRDGQRLRAREGDGVRQGERVETGSDGHAELLLPGEGYRSLVLPRNTARVVTARAPAPRWMISLAKTEVEATNYRAFRGSPARLARTTAVTSLPVSLDWTDLSGTGGPVPGRLTLYDESGVRLETIEGPGRVDVPRQAGLAAGKTFFWDLELPGGRLVRGDFTYLDPGVARRIDAALADVTQVADPDPRRLLLYRAGVLTEEALYLRADRLLREALQDRADDGVLLQWLGAIDRLLGQPSAASRRNTVENLGRLAGLAPARAEPGGLEVTVEVPGARSRRREPIDGRAAMAFSPGDRAVLRFANRGPMAVDVTLLYADAAGNVGVIPSPRGRVPAGEARVFEFRVTAGAPGRESLFLVAIPVGQDSPPADAGFVARPTDEYVRAANAFSQSADLRAVEDLLLRARFSGAYGDPARIAAAAARLRVYALEWDAR